MADGQVVFEVSADGKHVKADIKDITRAIEAEGKKWDQTANDATKGIENSFSKMAGSIAAKLSAAGIATALISFGKAAVDAASDLSEVQNVVDTVFGDGAKKIETWAREAGQQFGLTETQAKKFTSTLGAMMKSSGMAGDEIIGMSTDLAGLAADMASFYNLDFETAFEKIRSGISGQTMPLKQLGIDMSVANLEAFALAQGLEKTFSQMSQGEQTMLRYQYLMQATSDAQGDFSRTADGFANAQRRIQSSIDSIQTSVGKILLPAVEDAIGKISEFLAKIAADMLPEETVLDKFAAIDLDTETKIAELQKVAEEAGLLSDNLEHIATKGYTGALSTIAEGANKLNASSPGTWKAILSSLQDIDGLSNIFTNDNAGTNIESLAEALSSSDVNTDKATAWQTFLGALSENADAVSKLTGKSVDETVEWLNKMSAAVNEIDPTDAAAWDTLLSTLVQGFATDTPEGQEFVQNLAEQFLSLGKDSDAAVKGLEALGFNTDEIAEKQSDWLETCKRLVSTIPGLNSIINTETGEVKGGVDAIRDYVQAWQKGQEQLAYLKMHEQKGAALEEAFGDLPGLKLDADMAAWRIKKQFDKVRDIYKKYGKNLSFDEKGKVSLYDFTEVATDDELKRLNEFKEAMEGLDTAYTSASKKYKDRKKEYEEAKQMYEEEGEMLSEYADDVSGVEDVVEGYLGKTDEEWKEHISAVQDATKALADYYKTARDATANAVNSVIKGFEKVESAGAELERKREENGKALAKAEKDNAQLLAEAGGFDKIAQMDAEAFKKLTPEVQAAYNEIVKLKNEQHELNEAMNQYKPEGMKKNLQSQITYMDEYLKNLKTLQDWGISDSMLASLSDGSKESAEYLKGLVEGGPEAAASVDELYKTVEEKKKGFTDALTDQKLAADETFQGLVTAATAAVDALDLYDEAEGSLYDTIEGIADGITEAVPDVAQAVDQVLAELNRLSEYGLDFGFDENGGIELHLDGSNAKGLDYVPFDGYLSELHEGEGILTAEENRIWQRFKNGDASGRNVDYDALGGLMRDNVKAGGNVYLDGRTVGQVVSDIQGNQFRTMQRSGFQG